MSSLRCNQAHTRFVVTRCGANCPSMSLLRQLCQLWHNTVRMCASHLANELRQHRAHSARCVGHSCRVTGAISMTTVSLLRLTRGAANATPTQAVARWADLPDGCRHSWAALPP